MSYYFLDFESSISIFNKQSYCCWIVTLHVFRLLRTFLSSEWNFSLINSIQSSIMGGMNYKF